MDIMPSLSGFLLRNTLTPELALWQLKEAPQNPAHIAQLLAELVQSHPQINRSLATAMLSHLEQAGLLTSQPFLEALGAQGPSLEKSPLGMLVLAQCAEMRGDVQESIRLFRTIHEGGSGLQGQALLDLARVQARGGAQDDACEALRLAAQASHDFPLLTRAAKLLLRLKKQAELACTRTLRIALLTPYTTDLWIPLLRLGLFREGIWGNFYTPPYGNHEQALRDPDSALFAFDPELVILAPTWHGLNLSAFSEDPAGVIQNRVAEVVSQWKLIQGQIPAHLIQHNFEIPAIDPNGYLGHTMPGGRASIIGQINNRLFEEARNHHVTVLNVDQLAANYGKRAWADPSYWHTAKQYPAPAALPALVDGQVMRIRAGLGLTKKVLVLDLDNTLWGGVIGEEGLNGIQIGPPSATGEAHLALQRYAAQLKERGILLAVCSKNNEDDAKVPFIQHEGMHLHLDDFVAFIANWQDKPSNLRNLAKTLNLGLDSFVFVDDNPAERARVRQELPQVAVPEIGSDPAHYVEILDAAGYFDADTLSPEDMERSQNYRNNMNRDSLRANTGSVDDFLQALNMTCEHGAFNDHVLGRVVQLLGKTNQFNLTTKRHTDAQIRQILANPQNWTQYFRLKDKFDDNGLVGLMIAVPHAKDPAAWEVDTWLMSCRVIGRQLENFMFNTLMAAAREQGIQTIYGRFSPTAKNGMVLNLYPDMGFTAVMTSLQDAQIFRIDPSQAPLRPATFIKDLN
jgi:FkbH-like protein